MRIKLYNLIKDRLNGIKSGDKPLIKYVDIWNNQTSMPVEEQAFRLPAVFVEINGIQYGNLTNGRQNASVDFTLHVVTDSRKGKADKAMETNFEVCNIINATLCGVGLKNYIGSIVRAGSMTDSNFDEWIENQETYHCYCYDDSALKKYDLIEVENLLIKTTAG